MKAGRWRQTAEALIMDSTSKGPMNFGTSFLEVDFMVMFMHLADAFIQSDLQMRI